MLPYILGGVVVLVIGFVLWLRSSAGGMPLSFPPGSRAFEAYLTLDILANVVRDLHAERATADPARCAVIERELAFYDEEAKRLQAIVDARDVSPGQGYVSLRRPPGE
ncbi:MAG: hypothetical protein R6X02_33430 [Enhygromyxa sp.]